MSRRKILGLALLVVLTLANIFLARLVSNHRKLTKQLNQASKRQRTPSVKEAGYFNQPAENIQDNIRNNNINNNINNNDNNEDYNDNHGPQHTDTDLAQLTPDATLEEMKDVNFYDYKEKNYPKPNPEMTAQQQQQQQPQNLPANIPPPLTLQQQISDNGQLSNINNGAFLQVDNANPNNVALPLIGYQSNQVFRNPSGANFNQENIETVLDDNGKHHQPLNIFNEQFTSNLNRHDGLQFNPHVANMHSQQNVNNGATKQLLTNMRVALPHSVAAAKEENSPVVDHDGNGLPQGIASILDNLKNPVAPFAAVRDGENGIRGNDIPVYSLRRGGKADLERQLGAYKKMMENIASGNGIDPRSKEGEILSAVLGKVEEMIKSGKVNDTMIEQ